MKRENAVEKLLHFTYGNSRSRRYLDVAVASFFEEIEGIDCDNFYEFHEAVDESQYNLILPMLMEYFFNTIYQTDTPSGKIEEFNAVTHALRSKKTRFTKAEEAYVKTLRDSHMTIAKLIGITPDSVIFEDILDNHKHIKAAFPPVNTHVFKDISMLNTYFGIRLPEYEGEHVICGSLLKIEEQCALETAEMLLGISKGFEVPQVAQAMMSEGLSSEALQQGIKAIWAKEIFVAWWEYHATIDRNIVTIDGHPLEWCELVYPITSSKKAIEEQLNAFPYFHREGEEVWHWAVKKGPKQSLLHMQRLRRDQYYSEYAHASLDNNYLRISTKCRAWAEHIKAEFSPYVVDLCKPPLLEISNPDSSAMSEEDTISMDEVPKEELQALMYEFFDEHLSNTLKDAIPMLNNRSPKQAARSKAGRYAVTGWLLEMEENILDNCKRADIAPYDMSWVWDELKLERPDVA